MSLIFSAWNMSQKLGPSFYILFFLFISLLVDVVKKSPECFEFNTQYLHLCLHQFLRAEFINSSDASEVQFSIFRLPAIASIHCVERFPDEDQLLFVVDTEA
jgi:hypothetical protein